MAVALDPAIVTRADHVFVGVATGDENRGLTYIDLRRTEAPAPNLTVVWDVDGDAFKRRLFEMCAIR